MDNQLELIRLIISICRFNIILEAHCLAYAIYLNVTIVTSCDRMWQFWPYLQPLICSRANSRSSFHPYQHGSRTFRLFMLGIRRNFEIWKFFAYFRENFTSFWDAYGFTSSRLSNFLKTPKNLLSIRFFKPVSRILWNSWSRSADHLKINLLDYQSHQSSIVELGIDDVTPNIKSHCSPCKWTVLSQSDFCLNLSCPNLSITW